MNSIKDKNGELIEEGDYFKYHCENPLVFKFERVVRDPFLPHIRAIKDDNQLCFLYFSGDDDLSRFVEKMQ